MRRIVILISILLVLIAIGLVLFGFPAMTARAYGPPAGTLNTTQVIQYSAKLMWYDGLLTQPLNAGGPEQRFQVSQGESVGSIGERLAQAGLISDASAFRDYLAYTGLDATVQAGDYKLSSSMSIVDIARRMQDATPAEVSFVILPGWRIEEVAAALPTSGLDISPEDFIAAATAAPRGFDFLSGAPSAEGFLYPDSYIVPRSVTANQFLEGLLRNFGLHLTVDLREGFSRRKLSVFQAVTLASIIEREAVHNEEAPLIASVYLNRLRIGMKLDADPTIQYALGYNPAEQTWWTSPLSLESLQISSTYNTYIHAGLPPSPIASPGLSAVRAVASPADTPYYYFQARCDGSGYHDFAETFAEHMQNFCP